MDIEYRIARADDRGPIAELIHSSGPEFYDYLYGGRERALAFLRHELASGRGFTGYPGVTVALLDGEVVGTGCFYDREQHARYMKESVGNVWKLYGLRAAPVLLRSRHVGSVLRRPKPGELYLANFGVSSALRSQGIGSGLIAHALERAASQGYTIFGLDVATNNPRGQALYERLGLTVRKEKAFSNPSAGVPNARKMERALTSVAAA